MTATGMSLGTPHYMSPEQAMGEREITARSDVYSLGAVMYEMLVGEPPFTGPTAQAIVAKVLTTDPEPPRETRKSIPLHVQDAVLLALEKLPADRFATAAAFGEALANPNVSGPHRLELKKRRLGSFPYPNPHRCRSYRQERGGRPRSRFSPWDWARDGCCTRFAMHHGRRRCRCASRFRSALQASTGASSISRPTAAESFKSSPTATASTES